MTFPIIKLRKVWYSISAILILLALAGTFIFGFNLSLHFTGGLQVKYTFDEVVPSTTEVKELITTVENDYNLNKLDNEKIDLGSPVVVGAGENSLQVRLRVPQDSTAEQQQQYRDFKEDLTAKLAETYTSREDSSFTISPSVGQVLKERAIIATILALIAIVLYIVFAFRKLPKNYNPWIFGFNTIVALAHDVIILIGVFVFLGQYMNVEIGPFFITALLTVLGYSVNDSIVVFDRVRENMTLHSKESIERIAEDSVWQTMARSINTSVTVLIVLGALLIFGAESIQMFVLALFIGVVVGTYSSIFIASPLLVTFQDKLIRKKS